MHFDIGHGWNDYGHLSVIARDSAILGPTRLDQPDGYRGATISAGVTRIQVDDSEIRTVSDERIRDLLEVLRGPDARTRVAITRWKRSMARGSSLTDKFIDLRIASKRCWCPTGPIANSVSPWQCAVHGGWVRMRSIDGRSGRPYAMRTALLPAPYTEARRKRKVTTAPSLPPCSRTPRYVRDGILRVLQEGSVKDWTDVILNDPRPLNTCGGAGRAAKPTDREGNPTGERGPFWNLSSPVAGGSPGAGPTPPKHTAAIRPRAARDSAAPSKLGCSCRLRSRHGRDPCSGLGLDGLRHSLEAPLALRQDRRAF